MPNENPVLHSGGVQFEEEKGVNAIEGISYFQATKLNNEYF